MKRAVRKTATIKTQYGSFTAVFSPEPDMGGYSASVPKVRGAVSWGKNLPHAKRMIAEAIEGAIEARILVEAAERGTVRFTTRAKHFELA